jgi:tetratricopeptide (TPR) repeat protein
MMMGFSLVFAQDYSMYSPDARKTLANDWLNTGKAYLQVKKYSKAKNCFLYATRLYPMGEAAAEARQILASQFKVKVAYDPEQTFASFVAEAQKASNLQSKINLYLMALDAKKDARIYEQVALCYLQLGNKDKAKEYALMAKEAGLSDAELDSRLKNL